jgi:hypothetical protein
VLDNLKADSVLSGLLFRLLCGVALVHVKASSTLSPVASWIASASFSICSLSFARRPALGAQGEQVPQGV